MRDPIVFKSTIWTLVQRAKRDPAALSQILEMYRPPILNFILAKGRSLDAEDLTQEVFIRVCRPGFLETVEASKGKFRTLLLTVTKRVIIDNDRIEKAAIRGGGNRGVSLEKMREESSGFDPAEKVEEDPEFDLLWVQNLVRQGLLKYQAECKAKGSQYYSMFHDHVLSNKDQNEVARTYGRKIQDVKNAIHKTREKLRQFVEELVRDYAVAGFTEEMALISRYLNRLFSSKT